MILSISDFVLTMTNSMIGRMHLCGNFAALTEEKKKRLNEACVLYKKYRHILNDCTVRHHTDPVFYYRNTDKIRCLELRSADQTEAVAVVQRINCEEDALTVTFSGLVPGNYTVEFFPHREPETLSSEILEKQGLSFSFSLPREGKLIYLFKR